MNRIVASVFAFASLMSTTVFSENGFAVIHDEDGHSNIRESASIKSEVVGKADHGSIVFIIEEEGDWLAVSYWDGAKDKYGFLHRSRARPVENLKAIPVKSEEEKRIVFKSDSHEIEIETEKFDAKKLPLTVVRFPNGGEFVREIDGKHVWGTDGGLPRTRYKRIAITRGKAATVLPAEATAGLYEPNNTSPSTSVFFDKDTETLFITAHNSDGAGGYGVIFRIVRGEYRDRMIFPGY